MIDENLKNQYKSIKAPEGLKVRVMAECGNVQVKKSKKPVYKYVQVIAACLVVCFFMGFVGMGMTSSTVYLDGKVYMGEEITLQQSASNPAIQRAAINSNQVIEIDAKIQTRISLSTGEFTLVNSETGETIYSGNEYSVKGKVIIQVSLAQGESAELKLENILSSRTISLESNN